ncbi:YceD family protein [Corynebacterium xerosis]|jgi:uncharacterized protein|uniref:YceD family protein n=1 Tax=Corynebacterium xerosis TaxID=1725 RepID=A0ABV3UTC2_9CORY|nr:YceD family protein [Corynebacterium xerosis]SQB95664.1 putative metal-binding protein, possibly nucleic-acid binding protein [Clostridium paraputrificum]HJG57358.1 YceD family protein [Corynebacterium xerosis]
MNAASPFVFDVGRVLREGAPEPFSRVGETPERIGAEMIAVEEGAEVQLDGIVTPLGGGVLIDADVRAPLSGQCVRCLGDLAGDLDIHVSTVFSAGEGFVTGDVDDDVADEVPGLVGDLADITQAVIDEAVLALPFNPSCETVEKRDCHAEDTGVPEPDGVSGEQEDAPDPRWAGLAEKFGDLGGAGSTGAEGDK